MAIEVDEATLTLSLQGQSGDQQARAFGAGDRVANRYVVVRFLAEGGMGEVYEAIDEELHERVALKTVRTAAATDERARVGLRREVHLARKVTHENVCRLFDLGFHRETMFLTMEHLAGESLAQRLQRVGRLSPSGALPIAEGIAAGLDAAHQSGVVHGDLKPGNVMLVPSRDGERVVVTDFGIASWREPHDHALVDSGKRVVGSPGYMAPEKRHTGETTTAGDIYSFGVLLYRMVTGVLPFTKGAGDRKPAPPRSHVPDLDLRWDSAILRCLERNPSARFSRAGDVVHSLRAPARPRRRLLPMAVVAVAVAVGAAALAWWWSRPAPSPTRSQRTTFAVIAPHNAESRAEIAWLSPAIGEMLTTELSAGGGLRTVPRSLVAPVERELRLVDEAEVGPASLTAAGDRLGAHLILTGSYVATGEQLRLDMQLRVARTGRMVFGGQYRGSLHNLEDVVGRAAGDIRAKLDVRGPSETERAAARALLPANTDAARHYSEGLERVRRFEYAAAIVALERAAAADPAFAPTQAALADAHWYLGHEEPARDAAKRALELSAGRREEDRLFAQARYWQTAGESTQAVAVLDSLVDSHPHDMEYGIALTMAHLRNGDLDAVGGMLRGLRGLPRPWSDDQRLDIVELRLVGATGKSTAAQAMAQRLLDRGIAEHTLPFQFEGLVGLANALWSQGALTAAVERMRDARAVAQKLDDDNAVGGLVIGGAWILIDAGRLDEAAREIAATPWLLEDRRGTRANHLRASAYIALERGDVTAARDGFERSRRAAAAAEGRQTGQPYVLLDLARADLVAGDTASAARRAAEALGGLTGPASGRAYAQALLGDIALAEGDPGRARARYAEALRYWRDREVWLEAARLIRALAEVAEREGNLFEAETLARAAALALAPMPVPDDQALAAAVLARALLAQSRSDDARAALPAESRSERRRVRDVVAAVRDRVLSQ